MRTSLLRALSAIATPASVPPVPTEQMKPSTLPSVWFQISGPVVSIVALAVGDVVELVRPDRAVRFALRQLLGQPAGNLHVVVGIGVGNGRHLDQLGAAEPEHVLLLLALRFRDHDHGAKAEGIADEGQSDPGITSGAFHDHAARPQGALADRVLDDEKRGAVLHRLAGIHEFGLAQDGALSRRGGALERDQRRVADGSDDPVAGLHVEPVRAQKGSEPR